jgi:hypothetical protein
MKELDKKYQKRLDEIVKAIQNSEELKNYLEEEEEEFYQELRDKNEPAILKIYEEVALSVPLQLLSLEKAIMDEKFEGLFLPRILGYSVLRGVINDNYKYLRPQAHFEDVLLAICNSSNFDYIRKRIGQTIQMGFALSSDIWVTNLVNKVSNKKIRYFLQSQQLLRYRDPRDRATGLFRYKNQFRNDHFHTTEFPTNLSELKVLFPSVRQFIYHRILASVDNSSFIEEIKAFLDNKDFQKTLEFIEMLGLYSQFFELSKPDLAHLMTTFNQIRNDDPDFEEKWFKFLISLKSTKLVVDAKADQRISLILDKNKEDNLTKYYNLLDIIHGKGYVNDEAVEAVNVFYGQYEGLSDINQCVRQTILNYISTFMTNIDVKDYTEYFELSKIFPTYMDIFSNQQFNYELKELCLKYVKKLLKKYTDKRGKDYQDIKKFVKTNFVDLNFMKEKELVEFFKTRRKKKNPV